MAIAFVRYFTKQNLEPVLELGWFKEDHNESVLGYASYKRLEDSLYTLFLSPHRS